MHTRASRTCPRGLLTCAQMYLAASLHLLTQPGPLPASLGCPGPSALGLCSAWGVTASEHGSALCWSLLPRLCSLEEGQLHLFSLRCRRS